jgi:superfamily II DNA or RNA helicase
MDNKLFDYQLKHANTICQILTMNKRALDCSDTGTGKTYTSIAICRLLGLKPFIICPKSVISAWIEVLKYFEYNIDIDSNEYQLTTYNKMLNHKFMKNSDIDIYEWSEFDTNINTIIDYNSYLFIFDEVHKCKNHQTINANILMSLSSNNNAHILLLSATATDKLNNFYVYGYVFGFYSSLHDGNEWIHKQKTLLNIHNFLFGSNNKSKIDQNKYASRMCVSDMKLVFNLNQIDMEGIYMENYFQIEEQYDKLNQLMTEQPKDTLKELKEKQEPKQELKQEIEPKQELKQELKQEIEQNIEQKINKKYTNLARIQKLRQQIELLKINTFTRMAQEAIQNGKSVTIFVNFNLTLQALSKLLNTKCLIHGKQTLEERSKNINNFCNDKSRIIICNIQSGGCGISLHDTRGEFPRISLISPTWSAQDLIQVLGRIHRATSRSNSVQKIIFCKNTFEENISSILKIKINNIQVLNNGKNASKNNSMKNIIRQELCKVKTISKKEIQLNEDPDKVYNILTKLYNSKELYNNKLNSLNKNNVDKTNIKYLEFEYNLNKINKQIEIYENKLNNQF